VTRVWILRVAHAAARLPLALAMAALAAMMVLTFLDVMLRSLANAPLPSAAEVTEILLALTVFAALPATAFRSKQISVDLLDGLFGPRICRWRNALVELLFGFLLFWIVEKVWQSGLRTLGYGEVTLYLRIPVGWILLAIGAGLALGALAMILRGTLLVLRPGLLDGQDGAGSEKATETRIPS